MSRLNTFLLSCLVTFITMMTGEAVFAQSASDKVDKDAIILKKPMATKEQTSLFAELRKLPADKDNVVIGLISLNEKFLMPIFMYELANRLVGKNDDVALEWYTIGRFRMRYDLKICRESALQLEGVLHETATTVARLAEENPILFGRAGLRALEQRHLLAEPAARQWACDDFVGQEERLRILEDEMRGMRQYLLKKIDPDRADPEEPASHKPGAQLSRKNDAPKQQENGPAFEEEAPVEAGISDSIAALDDIPDPVERRVGADLAEKREITAIDRDGLIGMNYDFRVEKFGWLEKDSLIFSVNNQSGKVGYRHNLYSWNPGHNDPEVIIQGTERWCAGNGILAFQTGYTRADGGEPARMRLRSGPYGSAETLEITGLNILNWAGNPIGSELPWQHREIANIQGSDDCQWRRNAFMASAYGSFWTPLREGDGFVGFRFASDRPRAGTAASVRYSPGNDSAGRDIGIPENSFHPSCISYHAFREAYFLYPCAMTPAQARQIDGKCVPYWWLTATGGKLVPEEGCIRLSTDNTRDRFHLAPMRDGVLLLSGTAPEDGAQAVNRLLLIRDSSEHEVILEGRIRDITLSPDGCKVALRHGTRAGENDNALSVADLCRPLRVSGN